jgi:hypothetical protein
VKTYIEKLLTAFSGFRQTVFSFLIVHNNFFSQLTAQNDFFHSHSPTKQILISLAFGFDFYPLKLKIQTKRLDLGSIFFLYEFTFGAKLEAPLHLLF